MSKIFLVMLAIVAAVIIFIWQLIDSPERINNFEKCAIAGNPIMESFPRQCRSENGKVYTEEISNYGWSTFIDPAKKIAFQYPVSPSLDYVSSIDWPPSVQILDNQFSCTAGGSEIARAGITEEKQINGKNYCITKESEGAAGSTYTQYAYIFMKEGKIISLTFSFRFPQCLNYDEPRSTTCQTEQKNFDTDKLIDQIVQTLNVY